MDGIDGYSNSSCTAGSFSWPLDFLSRRSHPSSRSSLGQKARSDQAAPAVTPSVVSRQHPSPGRRDLPAPGCLGVPFQLQVSSELGGSY